MNLYKIFIVISIQLFVCNNPHQHQTNTHEACSKSTGIILTDSLDYETRIKELEKNLPNNFIIKQCPYFVIGSNLSSEETNKIIENTIGRAVECFYNNYFDTKPNDVTVILLFKDDATYRYWAKELYDDTDLSRFGYYKPSAKVMLMNISTGTGTLVHEITHALVRYDFPDIPSWFNEGLGSLYERCSLNNGVILGYVNWRLPQLQDAINDNSYTNLNTLVNTSEDEFYGSNSGFYYAQARYLCLYLQEKGLLKKFYKTFRDGFNEDKTGKKFLEQVLEKNLSVINRDYLGWVKTLRYEN
jgi:hypothetical protein